MKSKNRGKSSVERLLGSADEVEVRPGEEENIYVVDFLGGRTKNGSVELHQVGPTTYEIKGASSRDYIERLQNMADDLKGYIDSNKNTLMFETESPL